MLLRELAEASARVGSTRSRLRKVELLVELLGRLAPEEIEVGVAWLAGELRQGRIGIGGATLRACRSEEASPESTLTLLEVEGALGGLAALSGPGSGTARVAALRGLLSRATAPEQEFLTRLLFGELRQGALEGIGVEAVARAASVPVPLVRRALMLSGDLGAVARVALGEGERGLEGFHLELCRPLRPMLAETATGVGEALGRLGRCAFERKLDGVRVQAHRSGSEVRLFSRGLNDLTASLPEVAEAVRGLPVREIVLDGEVLALRPDGSPEPFQVTMRRLGRKDARQRSLPLAPFFFDCLHLDGVTLLDEPTTVRFEALSRVVPGPLRVARVVTADAEEAEAFLQASLEDGHEGVMAKALDAPWEAGSRGQTWLKIKAVHTLDLVVLAAEWGSGRRRGWLSNLHLGARDPEGGGYVMLGKTFKGMTDEILAWQTARLQELEVSRDDWTVYVRPELVVEVAVGDVQASPHYPAGLALRFARLKGYREDKRAEEADTVDTVRRLHRASS